MCRHVDTVCFFPVLAQARKSQISTKLIDRIESSVQREREQRVLIVIMVTTTSSLQQQQQPVFARGALSFKGDKKKTKKAKKAKSNQAKHDVVGAAAAAASSKSSVRHDDYNIDIEDDEMTAAERASFQKKQERELEELKSIATLSHRERVEAYNEKLSQLTEHNDIPRVSAAGNG